MATASQLTAGLLAAGLPKPHPTFLTALLTTNRTLPPVPALVATAKHRILSADITTPKTLDSSCLSFPANISNPEIQETTLPSPIFVQVLSVEDLSKSRWEQIEAIETVERGEATRGREVIRIAPAEEEEGQGQGTQAPGIRSAAAPKAGLHKLILQDFKGNRVFALELKPVGGIGLGMSIGAKMELKGCVVARGVVLLQPGRATVLGGKIEDVHRSWLENRKADLKAAMEADALH